MKKIPVNLPTICITDYDYLSDLISALKNVLRSVPDSEDNIFILFEVDGGSVFIESFYLIDQTEKEILEEKEADKIQLNARIAHLELELKKLYAKLD